MFRPLSETKFINDANLVSYWKLDETSGTTAVDSKGSNNGTWTNFSYGTGKYWNAGSFNGSSSRIDLPENSGYNFTTQGTVCAWIKSTATTVHRMILANYSQYGSGTPIAGYQFGVNNGGKLTFTFGNGGNYNPGVTFFTISGATTVSDGNWHHVVGVKTTTELKVYVDGVLDGTLSTSATIGYNSYIRANIGTNEAQPGTISDYFNGLIDDVAIFSRALSSTEVLELYEGINYGELVATPNTKLLLHLNGNSTDASGNGNNGTDTAISYVNGVFGQGASFNGSSSKISIPDRNDYDFLSGDFTISYWVNFTNLTGDPNTLAKGIYATNGWYIQYNVTNASFVMYDGGIKVTAFAHNISLGNWELHTYVKQGTNGKRYKNGKQQTLTTDNSIGTIVANSSPITLGVYTNLSQNRLNGKMDEVIIENRAWSATEVLNYYNQSKGVFAPKFTY